MSRKSAAVLPEGSAAPSGSVAMPSVPPVPSAFTFSSFGGPGDWEHYGDGPDEIDDTAMYGVKHDNGANIRPALGVELPAEVPLPTAAQGERHSEESRAQDETAAENIPSVPSPTVGTHEIGSSEFKPDEIVPEDSSARRSVQMSSEEGQIYEEPETQEEEFATQENSWTPYAQPTPPSDPLAATTPPPRAAEQDVSKLHAEIEQHRLVVAQMQSSIAEMHQASNQRRQHDERETQSAQQSRSELIAARSELEGKNALLEQTRSQFEQMKASLTASQHELESSKERVQQLENTLSETSKSLQVASDQFENDRSALQSSVTDLEASSMDARKTHDSEKQQHQEKLTELEVSLTALRTAADAAAAELKSAHALAEENSRVIEDLKKEVQQNAAEAEKTKLLLEKEKTKAPDLLPGLDPWFKGSLERFKANLEIEATAATVQEKLGAFISFVNNESRLRGVNMPFTTSGEAIGFQQQVELSKEASTQEPPSDRVDGRPKRPSVSTSTDFFMAHDGEFSPGGRPIMKPRSSLPQIHEHRDSSSVPPEIGVESSGAPPGDSVRAPPATAQYRPYRGGSLPSSSDHSIPKGLPKIDTQKSAYQPLGYKFTGSAAGTNSQTPTADRGQQPPIARNASSTPAVPTVASMAKPDLELFTDPFATNTVQKKPANALADDIMVPPPLKPKTPAPVKPTKEARTSVLPPAENLASLLPPLKMPHPSVSPNIAALQSTLSSFSSDYSFMVTNTKEWEKKASATRSRLEQERHVREEANEEHNNELFESDEIGYGDIKDLEDQQKAEEGERKAVEEREEYESYAKDVFGASFKQLQEQIAGLTNLYSRAEKILKGSVSGSPALHIREGDEDVEAGEAMGVLLKIHTAIDVRHTQVARCVAERDRRFKRTQTSVLYRRGEITEMKRVEKGFDASERRADVKAAVEKVERCKKLWKIMDAQAFQGVAENQEFIDELLKAVDAITDEKKTSKTAEEKKELGALLHQTRDVLSTVAGNSKRLMQYFEVVEMALNECEYDVSVTSAQLDGREQAYFTKLQGEKKAEDVNLKEESIKRLKAIDDDLKEAQDVVDETLAEQGKGAKRMSVSANIDGEDEEDKQRRLKAALDAAKRRNGEIA